MKDEQAERNQTPPTLASYWIKGILIALLCTVLAVVIPTSILEMVGRSALKQQIDRIRAAGEPLTWSELIAALPPIDDQENSALVLVPLIPELIALGNTLQQRPDLPILGKGTLPDWSEPWPTAAIDDIRCVADEYEYLLDKLDAVRNLSRGRYPLEATDNSMTWRVTHAGGLRTAAKFELLAAVRDAADGRIDDAIRRFDASISIGRSMVDEPSFLSAMVRVAIDATAIDSLERTLAAGVLDSARLTAISEQLHGADLARGFVQALRGDRVMQFDALELGRKHGWNAIAAFGPTTPPGPFSGRLNFFLGGVVKLNQAVALEHMTDAVLMAERPDSLIAAGKSLDAAVRSLSAQHFLARMVLPNYSRATQMVTHVIAVTRSALIALAIEQFRIDRDRWPETLGELMPRYLDAVPIDPFDGQPLRYRIGPEFIVVYSIAEDLLDGGGDLTESADHRISPDAGFRLLNPGLRGLQVTDFVEPPDHEPE